MTGSTFTFSGFETPESDDPLGIWDLAISELEVAPATAYNAVEQAAQRNGNEALSGGSIIRSPRWQLTLNCSSNVRKSIGGKRTLRLLPGGLGA